MADNKRFTSGGNSTLPDGTRCATDEVTYSGDTADVQLVRMVQVSGSEGSKSVVDLPGDATNGLDVDVTRIGGQTITSKAAGSERALSVAIVDGSGNQVTTFGGSGGTSSNFGSAVPSAGTAAGFSDGTNLQPARTFDLDSGAGTQNVLGISLRKAASGGSVELGTSSDPVRTDPTGTTTQPVSGTVTSNAGTNLNTSLLALESGGNLAAVAASASVLDDWDETDRCKVNVIAGQAGVAGGAGAVGATTQRTTLASDDPAVTALQVMDDWDETDRCKVNLIAAQAGVDGGSGSVTGKTQRCVLATDVALPAGNNNIGDVDIASALPAGTNNIGDVDVLTQPARVRTTDAIAAAGQVDALMNGLTALTPKFAVISASSSGNNTIVSAVASKKILVLRLSLSANGNVNAKFTDGAGGSDLTGLLYLTQYGGHGMAYTPVGLFKGSTNTALVLNLSGAVAVGGVLTYVEVD